MGAFACLKELSIPTFYSEIHEEVYEGNVFWGGLDQLGQRE